MVTTTLYCLPHAGGSSSSYLTWQRFLPPQIVVRPIELPGRGKRMHDPLYTSIAEAVDDVYARISAELDSVPYAFFGHSMGTILIYELARTIRACRRPEPVHVFFSGRLPPFVHHDRAWIHALSDEHFIEKVCQLGGTNRKIFANKELLDLFLPVLRADYGMVERYRHQGDRVHQLQCGITIFSGRRDHRANGAPLQRWQECTLKTCRFHEFDGDHFFIHPFKAEIAAIIHRTLTAQGRDENPGEMASHNETN